MLQRCFALWSLYRLMSSRPSLLQLCGLQKGEKDLPGHAWERMGCLGPLVRVDRVPPAVTVRGWCLQAHLTHAWQLTSCLCPAVLPCLNLLSLLET